jgi:ligand-binding sensor domain-containing protein
MKYLKLMLLFLLPHLNFAQPPVGQKPLPLPNGEAWLVSDEWFDKAPPSVGFKHIGVEQGLVTKSVMSFLLQDKSGFLWLSNWDDRGLIRYDGHEFRYFTTNPQDSTQLPSHNISSMREDNNGIIWIASNGGLTKYDPKTDKFRTFHNPLDSSSTAISTLYIDKKGQIWVSTMVELYRFDQQLFKFQKLPTFDVWRSDDPTHKIKHKLEVFGGCYDDEKGVIWASASTPLGQGLYSFDPANNTAILYPLSGINASNKKLGSPLLNSIKPDKEHKNLWITAFNYGLLRFDLKTHRWTQYVSSNGNSKNLIDLYNICSSAQTKDGKIWLTTDSGLTLFDPDKKRFYRYLPNNFPESPPTYSRAYGLLIDRDDRLWVSSKSISVHDSKHIYFERINSANSDKKGSLWYDAVEDKTWFAYNDDDKGLAGAVQYDEKKDINKFYLYSEFKDKKTGKLTPVKRVCKTGNLLWCMTDFSLHSINLNTGKLNTIEIPLGIDPISVRTEQTLLNYIVPAKDNSLWLAASNSASKISLIHYVPNTNEFTFFGEENGLPIGGSEGVFLDKQGCVWVSTKSESNYGVIRFNPNTLQTKDFKSVAHNPNSLSGNTVLDMKEDNNGRIWMGTSGGLCWYDRNSDRIYRVPNNDKIAGNLTIDNLGCIWACWDIIQKYDPNTGLVRQYDAKNGIKVTSFEMYVRQDGAVCFNDQFRIFPHKIPQLQQAPTVYLTDFKVFENSMSTEKQLNFMEKIELPFSDNFFAISWSAISYTNPEQDQYAYILRGVDTGWVYCGLRNTASYTKIASGNYIFQVKSANRDGIWGPVKTLEIIIVPAWYQTFWFKCLVFLGFLGVFYAVYRNRLNQARLKSELKEQEALFKQKEAELKEQEALFKQREAELNQRIAEVQMAALRAQMNPHFIFNSLNSINRFIQLSDADTASNYLTKFSRLIRQVLDNSRTDLISLEAELEANVLYMEMESLRFAGQFQFTLNIDETVQPATIDVQPLLIQPYLENAVWHGLMQKDSPDRQLTLDISLKNQDLLIISIEDNGIGRAAAKLLKSKSATKHKSQGMDVTEERMSLYHQTTGRNIEVKMLDLVAPNGEALGTKVIIQIEI